MSKASTVASEVGRRRTGGPDSEVGRRRTMKTTVSTRKWAGVGPAVDSEVGRRRTGGPAGDKRRRILGRVGRPEKALGMWPKPLRL